MQFSYAVLLNPSNGQQLVEYRQGLVINGPKRPAKQYVRFAKEDFAVVMGSGRRLYLVSRDEAISAGLADSYEAEVFSS